MLTMPPRHGFNILITGLIELFTALVMWGAGSSELMSSAPQTVVEEFRHSGIWLLI